MTGWSNVTARFAQESHADALSEDVAAGENDGLRVSYNETINTEDDAIVRFRLVGYGMKERALEFLEAAHPIETALVATFNDTSCASMD
jgi:hypothetical protein